MDSVVNGRATGGVWAGATILTEWNPTHHTGPWDQNKAISANDGSYAWNDFDVEYVERGTFFVQNGPAWDESYYGVVCHSTANAVTEGAS